MKNKLITIFLLLMALIHLLPVSGLLGIDQLHRLYGVSINGPDMEILMRHRAVLFGLLGVFFVYAAFKPALQPLAFVAALVSMASFVLLAYSVGGYNAAIQRVVLADGVAAVCWLIAVVLYLSQSKKE
jgi:uncharacterized BrkB/YihY/UPF0761 family membrane protein